MIFKGRFFQKVMAKFSNLSNRHACEPKIVFKLLFPVNVINTIWAIFLIHLSYKSAYYELKQKILKEIFDFNVYIAFKTQKTLIITLIHICSYFK